MSDQCLGSYGLTTEELGWWRAEAKAYSGVEVGELGMIGGGRVYAVGWNELE